MAEVSSNLSYRHRILIASALLLSACSSGSNTRVGLSGSPLPKTPEQAIRNLSVDNRQAFETWKKSLIKSCDAEEAFGVRSGHEDRTTVKAPGLDITGLISSNAHSLLIRGSQGAFAILENPVFFSDRVSSKVQYSELPGDASYNLEAELIQDGPTCTVWLYGQKIYETQIAESLSVTASWDPEKSVNPVRVEGVLRNIAPLSGSEMALSEMPKAGIADALWSALTPNLGTIQFLASYFGLTETDASRLFRLRSPSFIHSLRTVENHDTLWFNSIESSLIGPTAFLTPIFDRHPHSLDLELRIKLPLLLSNGLSNNADLGTWVLQPTIEIKGEENPDSKSFQYLVSKLILKGVSPFDSQESSKCLTDRARVLKAISAKTEASALTPSFAEVIGPCAALNTDTLSNAYADGSLSYVVQPLLEGVNPTPELKYQGWDRVFSRLFMNAAESGKNIRETFDPKGNSKIVAMVADNLLEIQNGIKPTHHLDSIHRTLYQMGVAWSLSGQKPPAERVTKILKALDQVVSPFRGSAERLVKDLSAQATSSDEALAFAETVDDAYKTKALKALEQSRTLDYSDFRKVYFDLILQKRPTAKQLEEWSTQFQEIRARISNYDNLKALKSKLTALSTQWISKGEITIAELDGIFSPISNVIEDFPESTERLLTSLAESLSKDRESITFAKSITPEYKAAINELKELASAANAEDWMKTILLNILQKRPTSEQVFRWKGTLQAVLHFSDQDRSLLGENASNSDTEHLKKMISRSVEEEWTSEDFGALEQIAKLAKFKAECGKLKALSSMANCTGMDLYSRKAGKFMSPEFFSRYPALAVEFQGYLESLQPEVTFFTLKNSLMKAFFGSSPIWSRCQLTSFQSKQNSLKYSIQQIQAETDPFRRWELEHKVEKTLKDCT